MDISVVIPVYNVREYIAECLQSVINQKGIEDILVECILVNDRTPDDSFEIVRKIISAYSGPIKFITIEREENGGLSAARNTGIKSCSGKYLYFLDSDDFISTDCLYSLWQCVRRYPGVNIVYGKSVSYPDPESYRKYFDISSLVHDEIIFRGKGMRDKYLRFPEVAWNKLILADWVRSHNLYFTEGLINEDYAWHLKSYFYIDSYVCKPDAPVTYFYRQRLNSIISEQPELLRQFNIFRIMVDTAVNAPFWDNIFFRYILESILHARFNFPKTFYNEISPEFRTLCNQLLEVKHVGLGKKMLLRYSLMSKSVMKVRILNKLTDVFCKVN